MSMFGSIMTKIFSFAGPALAGAAETVPDPSAPPSTAPAAAVPSAEAPSATPAAAAPVDVGAVLTQMASEKAGGGNWQTSIVDLLKLLDLDSSLDARKQLANELNVHVGADGTAEENVALHKAVMLKLSENGGKVPADLKG